MKVEAAPFDAADYLSDEETIAEYLTAALSVYQKTGSRGCY